MARIDEEFSALLDEHWRIEQGTDRGAYRLQMLDVCRRILDNRRRANAEQGAHYWARQERYWEKEAWASDQR